MTTHARCERCGDTGNHPAGCQWPPYLAAAKAQHDRQQAVRRDSEPVPWDQIREADQRAWIAYVAPLVDAALTAQETR